MNLLDRARRYIGSIHAVSGSGGHGATFTAASALIHGFGLDQNSALNLLREWNEVNADPPWSEADLRHKIDSAEKSTSVKGRGYLLREDERTVRPLEQNFSQGRDDQKRRFQANEKPSPPSDLDMGLEGEIKELAELRKLSPSGLLLASTTGVLRFGTVCGRKCWIITDRSGRTLEARRMDGQPFGAIGSLPERKAHTLKHSRKNAPVGIHTTGKATFQNVLLVEGGPDLLAAFHLLDQSKRMNAQPVAFLSRNITTIDPDSFSFFRGKHVGIYPHVDPDGKAVVYAKGWAAQIKKAGAASVRLIDLSQFGDEVGDLNDLASSFLDHPFTGKLERLLPPVSNPKL